ncbi:MAG TPA: hypothetical protein PKE45_06820 [Caldilineaceae bacterium]|nr:hypothetical protein [Caldilineaceae bacterium]
MKNNDPVATIISRTQNNTGQLTQLIPFANNWQGQRGLSAESADQTGNVMHQGESTPARALASCSQGFSVKALRHAVQAMFS